MTDTRKATPRPWTMLQGFPDYIVTLTDRDKKLSWSEQPGYAKPFCETHGPNNKANAALIVQAVNAFDAMREALERCLEVLNIVKDTPKSDAVDMARRALRLAAAEEEKR